MLYYVLHTQLILENPHPEEFAVYVGETKSGRQQLDFIAAELRHRRGKKYKK